MSNQVAKVTQERVEPRPLRPRAHHQRPPQQLPSPPIISAPWWGCESSMELRHRYGIPRRGNISLFRHAEGPGCDGRRRNSVVLSGVRQRLRLCASTTRPPGRPGSTPHGCLRQPFDVRAPDQWITQVATGRASQVSIAANGYPSSATPIDARKTTGPTRCSRRP